MDLADFFHSGRVADLLLAVMALEFVTLTLATTGARRPAAAIGLMFALGPGACLTVALRMALTGAPWPYTAFWLTAALPIHLGDVVRRRRAAAA